VGLVLLVSIPSTQLFAKRRRSIKGLLGLFRWTQGVSELNVEVRENGTSYCTEGYTRPRFGDFTLPALHSNQEVAY
jgi:hypothetical protein